MHPLFLHVKRVINAMVACHARPAAVLEQRNRRLVDANHYFIIVSHRCSIPLIQKKLEVKDLQSSKKT